MIFATSGFFEALVLALTLHKGMAKHVVRDCGVPTAAFAVVASDADAMSVDLSGPLFVKPVAEGTGKGISAASLVSSAAELRRACRHLLSRHQQPVLVEAYLPGAEFTVGITGTGRQSSVLGVMEVLMNECAEPHAYSYHNKEHYEDLVQYRLVEGAIARSAADLALAAWRVLGCRDGGRVDVRLDASGVPQFLEVNPLPGLNPRRSDLAIFHVLPSAEAEKR